MEVIVGIGLGILIGVSMSFVGMDRDKALYPAIMIVIASYYWLFAVMGGSSAALAVEIATGAVFVALAIVGFKFSLWIVAAALAGHGLFDLVHSALIENPGVPLWWPGFCSSIDITLGAYLALLLVKRKTRPGEV